MVANGSDEDTGNNTQRRQRSPRYPSDGLETCYKWTKKVYDAEKRNVTPTLVAAKHMGYSSLSGASRTALAAMKKFGLVSEEPGGEAIRVTEDAQKLFLDPNEDSRLTLLRKLALMPVTIKELLTHHAEGLPSQESLKYKLVTERGFGPDAADTFIKALNETIRFAKLEPGQYVAPQKEEPQVEQRQDEQQKPRPPFVPPVPPPVAPAPGGKLHVWSLGGGVTVEMRTSGPLTSKQVDRLRKYVDLAIDAEADEQATAPTVDPTPTGQA
jgi:hypothetical protein